MKISVIGCGYLGAVHAVAMASLGHNVVGIDSNRAKISSLSSGQPTILEPGFADLLREGLDSGRLAFSADPEAAGGARVHFIGVGTPQRPDSHAADLAFLNDAVDSLLPCLREGDVVAGKSTVPVGTAAALEPRIRRAGACLVWNPEFLREGSAVRDTLEPDRLVYGLSREESDSRAGRDALDECYGALLAAGVPRLTMDFATAELVKVAANSFLATKISFINAMSQACDATGADVVELARALGFDARIGRLFLRAGIGFGGGCLPKDIRALRARAEELDLREAFRFLAEVERINDGQRARTVGMLEGLTGGLEGRRSGSDVQTRHGRHPLLARAEHRVCARRTGGARDDLRPGGFGGGSRSRGRRRSVLRRRRGRRRRRRGSAFVHGMGTVRTARPRPNRGARERAHHRGRAQRPRPRRVEAGRVGVSRRRQALSQEFPQPNRRRRSDKTDRLAQRSIFLAH